MENAERVKIIAEMAWAHDGSCDKAIRIMQAAAEAGADAIGVHVTDMPTYMVPHYGSGVGRVSAGKEHMEIFGYLNRINLKGHDWVRFAKAANQSGVDLCVMANDFASLEFVERDLHPAYYVLSAAAFVEPDFVEAVADKNRTTLFRTGGATLGEIESAIFRFRSRSQAQLVLLHGFQNYPTKLEDTNIRQMESLARIFGLPVGLADHVDGGDPVAKVIPIAALACGATWIEKHITWNREEKGEDFEAALNPSDFKALVGFIRAVEIALGCADWGDLSDASRRYREVSRKRAVAACDLAEGATLCREDIVFKRSDKGITGDQLSSLLGRRLTRTIAKDDGVDLQEAQ